MVLRRMGYGKCTTLECLFAWNDAVVYQSPLCTRLVYERRLEQRQAYAQRLRYLTGIETPFRFRGVEMVFSCMCLEVVSKKVRNG